MKLQFAKKRVYVWYRYRIFGKINIKLRNNSNKWVAFSEKLNE
jgi:hypothetical protein